MQRGPYLLAAVGLTALLCLPWLSGLGAHPPAAGGESLGGVRAVGPAVGSVLPRPMNPAAPLSASGQGRLLIVSTDPSAMPNDGLRTNLTAYPPTSFSADSSYQEGVSETIGGFDAVFGLFQNFFYPPVPFFSVFSNTTDATVHLAYWTNVTLITGQSYDFELSPSNGTVWTLTVNGAPFGGNESLADFDFGAVTSTWLGGLSFSEIALYPSATTAPLVASASLVMAVHHASGWYLPTEGEGRFSGTAGAEWGVEGRLQHPSLAPGAVETGTSIAAVPNGTVLWTGGPIPVSVSLSVPSTAVGAGAASALARITDVRGLPIPGAAVYFSDQLDGRFTPASVLTNSTGEALAFFETPNVSANASDLVVATVTTFGFGGFAGRAVALTPAQQLFIALVGGATEVLPGSAVLLTFRVSDGTGASAAGVYVAFTTDFGSISPSLAPTDADGRVGATVVTPTTGATVTLRVVVAASGVWGFTVVELGTHPTAPSFWATYGAYVGAVGVLALVGLVAVGWVVRRRRSRQVLPPMNLRRDPPRPPPGRSDGGTTRTPP
ncbi:MAG TPA: Ig-like domain-containing protein [Thermoplasmata archaeon]